MTEHYFETRLEASTAAAKRMAELVAKRLDNNGDASIVVSGGTSPQQCMAALANAPLDWPRVQVLLSDERWVPADHEDSNEKLVRETLLVGPAAAAQFLPVYAAGVSPEERCDELQDPLPVLPFSCALIGIGTDGHFASLFPDAEQLTIRTRRRKWSPLYAHYDRCEPASPHQHDAGSNFTQRRSCLVVLR